MNNTMVREIRGAKINPKFSFKNQGEQNTGGRKLREQIRYIALGIVECAINLSAHAQILNTFCPGLLNVTEKFVDKTCTLLTVQRQFIIVISFELWGQHSASGLSFIFIITRQNSVTSSRESFPCLLFNNCLATNKKRIQIFLLQISMEMLLFHVNIVCQLHVFARVTATQNYNL